MALETDDPVKSKLLKTSAKYREDFEDEAKAISDRTEKIITNALIIGGSLALTYFAYKQFSGVSKKPKTAKKSKKTDDEGEEGEDTGTGSIIKELGAAFINQASVFLLNLAKEKLTQYLQPQEEKESDEHP